MKRIYLDYAATTPTHPDVVKTMLPYFTEKFGNPSAIYACAQETKAAIEDARSKVARLLGARDEEIVFTSGGTEANNFAIKGTAYANKRKGNHIITNVIEHHAVLETCHFLEKMGYQLTILPVDSYGMVSPDDVRNAITPKTILITTMMANNEIGTIQPIAEISKIAREAGVYFHTDAVQTACHLPINVDELGVDMLSMSAHKFYGPKGVGALYIRKGTRLVSFMHGGGQERNRRASTENVPGIVGMGKAVELAMEEIDAEATRITRLRDKLIKGLFDRIDPLRLNGHPQKRLPNNVNISIAFVEGEAICLNLDVEGICASTGSACSSGSLEPSHVMLTLKLPPEEMRSSIRFSLGKWTTDEEIEYVLDVLPRIVNKLRAMSPLLKTRK